MDSMTDDAWDALVAPKAGEENFIPRPMGRDVSPGGCFVCGSTNAHFFTNFASYVEDRDSGARVVAMFGDVTVDARGRPVSRGAWLDWRPREPDYLQVKVGACEAHTHALEWLRVATSMNCRIDAERVAAARSIPQGPRRIP